MTNKVTTAYLIVLDQNCRTNAQRLLYDFPKVHPSISSTVIHARSSWGIICCEPFVSHASPKENDRPICSIPSLSHSCKGLRRPKDSRSKYTPDAPLSAFFGRPALCMRFVCTVIVRSVARSPFIDATSQVPADLSFTIRFVSFTNSSALCLPVRHLQNPLPCLTAPSTTCPSSSQLTAPSVDEL